MRIRSIKPAFFKNEMLAELPLSARVLFVGLWGLSDCEGRMEYRPKYIKAEIFPYDDFDVPGLLDALATTGFIRIYDVKDGQYIQVVNFIKHQRINGKEAAEKSVLPPPPERREKGSKREATGKQLGSIGEAVEITGREGKGREGNTEGKEIAAIAAPAPATPQAEFVLRFKQTYEAGAKQPFKAGKTDYVLAADMIREFGMDACAAKAMVLADLCDKRSAWFTKDDGWGAFTIGKLSNRWNDIVPRQAQPTKDDELSAELKKQEALRVAADRAIRRG